MKITCLGTGTMGSVTRGNQSILVDDILFDVGSGVVKKLEALKLYTKNIKTILITHAHADHFVDLPDYLIGRNIRRENQEKIQIICGKGIRRKTIQLFEICFGNDEPGKYENFEEQFNVEFIELEDGETFETENAKITAHTLEHNKCKPILGYTLEKEGKIIGYATDTTLCENVRKICEQSDIVFLDATNPTPTQSHMGLNDVIELSKEYSNKQIYAIHRSDYEHEEIPTLKFPEDEEIITL